MILDKHQALQTCMGCCNCFCAQHFLMSLSQPAGGEEAGGGWPGYWEGLLASGLPSLPRDALGRVRCRSLEVAAWAAQLCGV